MSIQSTPLWALFFLGSLRIFGQQAVLSPAFDAASIKPSEPGDTRGSTFQFTPGGGLTMTNGALKGLIESAYDVRDFQILDGPRWLDSDRYKLIAQTAPDDFKTSSVASANPINQTRRRLQALLAQRFQLQVHRETRELPVYVLTAAKNGSRLVENDASNASAVAGSGIRSGCGQMTGTRASMANLTVMLSRQLGRPVLDRTGLTGKYDFHVDWTPDTGPCSLPSDGAGPTSSNSPSLFTALQETLGLKLESTKGPVEIIVVDHAAKADEN